MASSDVDVHLQQQTLHDVDDIMQGSGDEDDEGEGDVVMPDDDDSSEEGEDDEEEARRIREGFIVDEDEDEDEEGEEEEAPRKRRKRRKRHHREEETLEEDDLELLEENTGGAFKRKSRLVRLRHRDSESPPTASSSKRAAIIESSEDDFDHEEEMRELPDIRKIWDDDRRGDEDDEDMSDFIDDSEEDEGGVAMNEEAREARRQEKRQEQIRRKRARVRPELAGIDANAWDEIHDVFGDGHEYDWALIGDDEAEYEEEQPKAEMKYHDVFEPSEIQKRMLTDDDDLIRHQDIPERMQLETSSLSEYSSLSLHTPLKADDIGDAAMWVTQKIPRAEEFFSPLSNQPHLQGPLVMAVTYVLQQLFIEEYEVPYIWAHKRDYTCHFDINKISDRAELLNNGDLWRINRLGEQFRNLLERRRTLTASYERLQVKDEYFEYEILPQLESVEVVTDATEWLSMKYKDKKQDVTNDFRFHDDEEPEALVKKRKMPSRVSAYEVAKKSVVSKLSEKFGIQPHQVVLNFLARHHVHFIDDLDFNPVAYAEQFSDPDPIKAQMPEELLRKARMIFATELGKDPLLRHQMRQTFKEHARFTVEPTERGVIKIDDGHTYFSFKYILQKPISDVLKKSAEFLHIFAAEAQHLVTVSIYILPDVKSDIERRLLDAFSSDNFSESAKAWNVERSLVVQEVIDQHLIPAGTKWIREYLREDAEDFVTNKCGEVLRSRIDIAPYLTRELKYGEFACSVLAISWGKGDPHKDAITLVYLDEAGRMREHTKIDNLHDQDNRDEFVDFINRRKPDVAVVGGFSVATLKLSHLVKEMFRGSSGNMEDQSWQPSNDPAFDIPTIFVNDDVARIYQHSKRAAAEFNSMSPTAKYCVGLARYVQSPLNEFAALGSDITAITFDEEYQQMVSKEKLLTAFEHVLVDVTNKVGVDINRAVTDTYYQHLLPFVCGLGPRKAQLLVKKIAAQGGTIVNRDQFIKAGLLTTKIFLNASGFLRVIQDRDPKSGKYRPDDENAPDPLDDTRIHPEDYELARKMATDALELDEEDIHDEHPSQVVTAIMNDKDRERKLLELNLDEFAISLYEANHDQKRHTLNVIREELLLPFSEKRDRFKLPTEWEVLTMLTGETPRTLGPNHIVAAQVFRIQGDTVIVRLDSGVEGTIDSVRLTETGEKPHKVVKKGQTITCSVQEIQFRLDTDELTLHLSCRPEDIAKGIRSHGRGALDKTWDEVRHKKDQEMLVRKKRAESDRTRRVIKHPNFHNFNTAQAEAYLEKQQRGDVVIRPSSKGIDHLAVTWKVDDKLYQHIDVTELHADPTGQSVGGQLRVDDKHSYSDLDELVVNHVQAMARRVEELMAHEKYKHGSEDELHLFLKNFLAANPAKSMYGFTLNRKRPGHFSLCFLANKNATVQTWPVRVAPEAYYLFDAAAVGVPELCDAFKVRHLHESQNLAVAGGKTPYGAGLRTPARTGGATPGHVSVRQMGRTPNPYGGGQTPFMSQAPPSFAPPPPQHHSYGYQTPSHRPPFPPQHPPMPPPLNPRPSGGWPQQWPL